MSIPEHDTPRHILEISGTQRRKFLQGLVSNDVNRLDEGMVYAALLTPQGKYLCDFLLVEEDGVILLDAPAPLAPALFQRLGMYKLRSDVTLTPSQRALARGLGDVPAGAYADPRDPALGWRAYDGRDSEDHDWTALRVAQCIPEAGIELTPDSYLLESRFEALNGVDFRKGCYVGQEVTARMKHKTELRKGLRRVALTGHAPIGTPLLNDSGKEAGTLYSQADGHAIAYLRFDRATGPLRAGDAVITP
ncbi:putative global regulator [Aquimixticola soesokkakensis]|uniref:Putative global regulator n=2 Tax=Aquimixticola soesokkakensis TaxID=1519096 RepID=A0A1Y5SH51_9RHOB|nr:putative global regulator [Aquimixticola soesokkakensis]